MNSNAIIPVWFIHPVMGMFSDLRVVHCQIRLYAGSGAFLGDEWTAIEEACAVAASVSLFKEAFQSPYHPER
jgi:hypothetical protein